MDMHLATKGFGALAQATRLEAFRLLVRKGVGGMAAGEIARILDVPQNTLSSHLATLVSAGLIESRRQGRSIIYAIDVEGTQALLTFLLEDCCRGRPEVCVSLLDALLPECSAPIESTSAAE